MNMKGKSRQEKAITLIALIITIVVLLILAVVAITSITNDGIIAYANNAVTGYKDSQTDERAELGDYEGFIDQYKPGGNDGSEEDEQPAGTTYTPYTIGQEVKLKDQTKETGTFYVIEESDETQELVVLLTKKCIEPDKTKSDYLTQSSSASTIAFSKTNYWENEFTKSPYDLREKGEPEIDKYALRVAYDYAKVIGAQTGTLMTYEELTDLCKINLDMMDMQDLVYHPTDDCLYYWLASAWSKWSEVCFVDGDTEWFEGTQDFDNDGVCCVRPVIKISKDLIEQVSVDVE